MDGIYTADPKKDPKAKKYGSLRYETALEKRLKVMDSAAFALCMENGIPIEKIRVNTARDSVALALVKQNNYGLYRTVGKIYSGY